LSLNPELPSPLSQLYKPDNLNLNYMELLHLADKVELSITPNQCAAVEVNTRDQSMSRLWFNMRTGRITASKLRAVCVADDATPPLSLIIACCYPESSSFKTSATIWGCQHEREARQKYSLMLSQSHHNFTSSDSGFFIHPDHPYLGASPDALVNCLCCGEGICEIKCCPHCHRNDKIDESVNDRSFCLMRNEDGSYQLKRDHIYFYQVGNLNIVTCGQNLCTTL
jgi:hypothetical protein